MSRAVRAAVLGVALGGAATAVCATDAAAQSASDLAGAKQLFSEGLKLEEAGKWAEARDRFQRVEAVKPTPQVTFHIGLCFSRTNELVEAVVWFERAKERAQQARVSDVEAAADAELKAIRPRVPTLELVVPKDATPTKVTIDGEQSRTAASGAPVLVNPGEHEVAVAFATGTVRKKIKVAEKDAAKLAVEPPQGGPAQAASATAAAATAGADAGSSSGAPGASGRAPASLPPESEAKGSRGGRVVPWVLVGGGVAAAAGGAVLMLTSIAKFRDVCPDVCPRSKEQEATDAHDSAVVPYYLGAGLVGAGAIAAGLGIYFLAAPSSSSPSGTATSAPPARVGPHVRMVSPVTLPGGGGACVIGTF